MDYRLFLQNWKRYNKDKKFYTLIDLNALALTLRNSLYYKYSEQF